MSMILKRESEYMEMQINMTIKFLKLIDDWKKEKIHPLPCICVLCIWRKYEKKKKAKTDRKRGRRYDMLTFFILDLIFDAKEVHLLETGKAKIIKKNGKTILAYNMIDHHNAPYIQRVKRVLEEFPEFYQYDLHYLNRFREEYFGKYARNKRYETSNILKLFAKLQSEIRQEWRKKHPESPVKRKEWARNWQDLRFAQRVSDFIHSKSEKEIPQHIIIRRFSKNKELDFEGIRDILKLNYNIDFHPKIYRGRKTGYYSIMKSSKGRYWRIGTNP